ncbi:bcl-2-binding component 3, isoforms 3/4-like [Lutra lutra]|uniref:bcl-2-binding component 3, isoforms 3/4-like n=1 Tax=Lutra lutra TaxID=9657 RepID=UPI001FD0545B|nr:bcl-2-binding component 3, isoforms 3/4-like [Lutra lutra]
MAGTHGGAGGSRSAVSAGSVTVSRVSARFGPKWVCGARKRARPGSHRTRRDIGEGGAGDRRRRLRRPLRREDMWAREIRSLRPAPRAPPGKARERPAPTARAGGLIPEGRARAPPGRAGREGRTTAPSRPAHPRRRREPGSDHGGRGPGGAATARGGGGGGRAEDAGARGRQAEGARGARKDADADGAPVRPALARPRRGAPPSPRPPDGRRPITAPRT